MTFNPALASAVDRIRIGIATLRTIRRDSDEPDRTKIISDAIQQLNRAISLIEEVNQ